MDDDYIMLDCNVDYGKRGMFGKLVFFVCDVKSWRKGIMSTSCRYLHNAAILNILLSLLMEISVINAM